MLKRIVIALGLLTGSFLAAWAASSTLSGLSAGAPISKTDLFYDVQTSGMGGVKVTGGQFLTFVFGAVSGSCTASGSGVFTCAGGGSTTSIVAGTNITTSGVATNTTVNTVLTPSFSSVTASGAHFQTLAIASINGTTQCVHADTNGNLSGTSTDCGSGGGTPGGANTQIQYNKSGSFNGDPGLTYVTPTGVTLQLGTTAVTGNVSFVLESNGNLQDILIDTSGNLLIFDGANTDFAFSAAAQQLKATIPFGWVSASPPGTPDTALFRDGGAALLGVADAANKTTATTLRVYNTTDQSGANAPTNYERGVLDWTTTANQFTVGTQQSGTGVGRNLVLIASGTRAQTISQTATTFAAAINAPAIAQLTTITTGYVCWTTGTGAVSEDSTGCLASLRTLKKDIMPLTDTTAELMALKPSQFRWKNPTDSNQRGPQLGFIAEDTHDVDARLASYAGNGSLHGWRQDAMIAALVRGFQEQQAIIREQQTQIDDLKRRLH